MSPRWSLLVVVAALTWTAANLTVEPPVSAQGKGGAAPERKEGPADTSDWELVQRLMQARSEYQRMLEQLRAHYINKDDLERARWAEEELIQYHRINKQAFEPGLVVPPPTLQARENISEANKLFMRAREFQEKGRGTDYIDNQRRAELLFQQVITQYPQSNAISKSAYHLGEIYESKSYKQFRLAALYYERAFQWNPTTSLDARLRAARLYDRQTLDRGRAIELYREILNTETDAKQHAEATKRLKELGGGR